MFVYKLTCNTTGKIYIGSTIQSLQLRLNCHKKKSNACISREIIKNNNYEIVLLEEVITNEEDLLKREQFYIDTTKCINIRDAYYTDEMKVNNLIKRRKKQREAKYHMKDEARARNAQIYIDNKEKITQYKKNRAKYIYSWGGDIRYNNNLWRINPNLFDC
tara:strand:- start:396 stop:878 length:483 start_codon:yes stop_codon:yes gene_type:complete